jgi:hypothetical protein
MYVVLCCLHLILMCLCSLAADCKALVTSTTSSSNDSMHHIITSSTCPTTSPNSLATPIDIGIDIGIDIDYSLILLPRQWDKIQHPDYIAKGNAWGRLNGAQRSREIPLDGKAPTLTSGYHNVHNFATRLVSK